MQSPNVQTGVPAVRVFPLFGLPRELLDMVFSHLGHTDILNLAKTSRTLRDFMEPFIYHDIILSWLPIPLERLLQLLRTFSTRPDLANHVARLAFILHDAPRVERIAQNFPHTPELDHLRRPRCWWTLGKEELKDQHIDTINYAILTVRRARIRDPRRWIQFLRNGNPYAYASLILLHCHHLRHLDLNVAFHLYGDLPGLIVKHALSRPWVSAVSKFPRLSDVRYGTRGKALQRRYGPLFSGRHGIDQEQPEGVQRHESEFPSMPSSSRNLAPFFLLPGLLSLDIFTGSYQPTQEIMAGPPVTIGSSNLHGIRSLSINGTILTTECRLGQFLSQMRFLEDLQLVSAADEMDIWPNKDDMLSGLNAVKPTLRNFSLEFVHGETLSKIKFFIPDEVFGFPASDPVGVQDSMRLPEGFFKEFCLKSIRIPCHCLIDVDAEVDSLLGPDYPDNPFHLHELLELPTLASLMNLSASGTSELEKGLPISIEQITLDLGTIEGPCWDRSGNEIIPTVFDFLTSSRGKFPHLRRICIIVHPNYIAYGMMKNHQREIESLGQVLDVVVEFRELD